MLDVQTIIVSKMTSHTHCASTVQMRSQKETVAEKKLYKNIESAVHWDWLGLRVIARPTAYRV